MTSEYKTEKSVKGLECAKEVGSMVKRYYEDALRAKEEGRKVAYCTASFPAEILTAMNIVPLYPENFSAACAAKQISPKAMEVAEAKGYSSELCSYFKCHLGYCFAPEALPRPPGGGMAPPDMLLGCENTCITHGKWMRILERLYGVPCYTMLLPAKPSRMFGRKIEDHFMKYALAQLKGLIRFLEGQTGTKLDMDCLREAVRLSNIASMFYDQCYQYRRAIPCPAGAEDFGSTIMPLIVLRGQPVQVEFYERLSRELGGKVKAGEGAVPEEKIRLLFERMPPYYTMGFYNYFDKFDAVFAYEHFNTELLTRTLDPSKPLESLALRHLDYYSHSSFYERTDAVVRAALEYRVDGAILGCNRSCKNSTYILPYMAKKLKEEASIPCLLLEYDHSDPRVYSDEDVKRKIDAFMEIVARHKEERERNLGL